MSGANAFAFDEGVNAFLPADPNSTATISAYRATPSPAFVGVSIAKNLLTGAQIWAGYPPTPTITSVTNTPAGSFPDKVSNVTVSWSIDANTITAYFDVYVSTGGSYTKHNVTPIASNATSYVYGSANVGTTNFKVRAVGTSGLFTESAPSGITISAPATISTLVVDNPNTTDTVAVWDWTVTGGVYQEFEVQRSTDGSTVLSTTTVASTLSGTSFTHSWTGRTQNTTYYLRVRGKNNNGHWSAYSGWVAATTDNTPPVAGTVTAAAVNVPNTYSNALAQGLTTTSNIVERNWTVTITPSNDVDFDYIELYHGNSNTGPWTYIRNYTTTGVKTYTYSENLTSAGTEKTKFFRTVQYDTYGDSVAVVSLGAESEPRYSSVQTTYSAGPEITETINGNNLSMFAANAEDDFGTGGTYNWAKTYDGNLNTYWLSDFKNFDSTPATYGQWVYVFTPDTDKLWSSRLNYYEFISYRSGYQVFGQLLNTTSNVWYGSANEPTGVNGDKYLVYLSSLGNQNTWNRITCNITETFGSTGADSVAWNSRIVLRNPQFETIGGTSYTVYGIIEFRVNHTYRNRITTNTTWYW